MHLIDLPLDPPIQDQGDDETLSLCPSDVERLGEVVELHTRIRLDGVDDVLRSERTEEVVDEVLDEGVGADGCAVGWKSSESVRTIWQLCKLLDPAAFNPPLSIRSASCTSLV